MAYTNELLGITNFNVLDYTRLRDNWVMIPMVPSSKGNKQTNETKTKPKKTYL